MKDYHLLIVEDDISVGNMLQESLEIEGYEVARAYSGTEALMLLEKKKPDLVLLDLQALVGQLHPVHLRQLLLTLLFQILHLLFRLLHDGSPGDISIGDILLLLFLIFVEFEKCTDSGFHHIQKLRLSVVIRNLLLLFGKLHQLVLDLKKGHG